MRNGVFERVDNVKRGRGRHKLTWDIALDRSAWRLAINVPEP